MDGHGRVSESLSLMPRETLPPVRPHRGKAPPVDVFTGENPEILLDDWLPALQRAATWNSWAQQEHLIQLAGYLRGRALQEWSLLDQKEKENLDTAIASLRRRLDPGPRKQDLSGSRFPPHVAEGRRNCIRFHQTTGTHIPHYLR